MLFWWIDSIRPARYGAGIYRWHLTGEIHDATETDGQRAQGFASFHWTVPALRNGGGRYAFRLRLVTAPDPDGNQRLPGDVGAVRDVEIEHPTFDLPRARPEDFALTAESGAADQPGLIGLEE